MEIHKPKTVEEAINTLQQFFECDLYSKFRPKEKIKGEVWTREDVIKNRKEFYKYLQGHFDILKEQIKEITN